MEEKRVDGGTQDVVCKQCGATFHGNFCPVCGAKNEAMATNGENMDFCPVCGFDRVGDAPFCANCGFAFVLKKQVETGASVAESPAVSATSTAPIAPAVKPMPSAVGMDLVAMNELDDMYVVPQSFASALDFKYRVNKKKGTVTITEYIGNDREVCVPPTIDGMPVVKIGEKAFGENKMISKVVLPEGLTTLGDWVFFYCTNLVSISFPSTLEKVGLSSQKISNFACFLRFLIHLERKCSLSLAFGWIVDKQMNKYLK